MNALEVIAKFIIQCMEYDGICFNDALDVACEFYDVNWAIDEEEMQQIKNLVIHNL